MDISILGLLVIGVVGALSIAAMVLAGVAGLRRRSKPPQEVPPMPTSLSFLAGFSFFSGLGAMALVVAAALLHASLSLGELLQVDSAARQGITLAAKIVLYVSLLPAVAAIAFALAARGVISESGGTVRGRPLYRTGVLLAILSGAVVLDARVVNPSTWLEAGRTLAHRGGAFEGREIHRGYLGVETGPLDSSACIPLVRVVPGSPADRAGLKAGDLVVKIDGASVYQLPPLGNTVDSSYSPGSTTAYIGSYIGSLSPGTKVALQVRRGKESVTAVAELAASFESLLQLLRNQTFDTERLAVFKAAGLDHRYSADELTKICATFDFDDARLKAIETALPLLQDPQNAYRILGSLEFSGAKDKVSSWIAKPAKAEKPEKEE